MQSKSWLVLLIVGLAATTTCGDDTAPANSELALEETFDNAELDKSWHVNTGNWRIVDGVLRASEIPSQKHSAAARRAIVTQNAVYQLRFRFVNEGESFHFGFDPIRGALTKRGHLFSVIVTPESWKILKHIDKDRPKEDPNETLVEAKTEFARGQWYSLRVTTWGNYVTAKIEGKESLKASHPTFFVAKPTLVFGALVTGSKSMTSRYGSNCSSPYPADSAGSFELRQPVGHTRLLPYMPPIPHGDA